MVPGDVQWPAHRARPAKETSAQHRVRVELGRERFFHLDSCDEGATAMSIQVTFPDSGRRIRLTVEEWRYLCSLCGDVRTPAPLADTLVYPDISKVVNYSGKTEKKAR